MSVLKLKRIILISAVLAVYFFSGACPLHSATGFPTDGADGGPALFAYCGVQACLSSAYISPQQYNAGPHLLTHTSSFMPSQSFFEPPYKPPRVTL